MLSPGSALSGRAWYPAAEQSIAALYALHPDPEGAASDVIRSFAAAAFNPKKKDDDAGQHAEDAEAENAEEDATENDAENDAPKAKASAKTAASAVDAAQLSRFLFVLGEVGLRHLVHVEGLGRAVRRARVARDRAAAEASEAAAAAGKRGGEEAELAAALGQGAVGEDLELDNAREACEAELLAFESEARGRKQSGKGLVAAYAPVVVALCGHPAIAAGHPLLRGAALAALSRLMAIDGGFCEAHLALIFTRLRDESDKGTRAALMVALGDLAFRFPNAVEPWTEHLYGVREWGNSLHDPDSGVRQHAITVLAHLVLNDMMKVKGHIAEMARCLEDPDPRVAAVAKLLFAELSRKHGNPIYNLLPDLLSRLSGDAATSPEAFRAIMTRLLGFIDKDRQTEALADKFVHRFAEAALAPTPKPARDVAFCISALALSDRAFKKFMDAWKLYEPALYDREVFAHLDAVVAKAKKTYGGKKAFAKSACETDAAGDVSALEGPRKEIEDFERRMAAAHVERFESYRSARRAEGHAVDEDETPAVTLGGGRNAPGRKAPSVPRSLRTPTARRTPRRAAAARRRRRRRRRPTTTRLRRRRRSRRRRRGRRRRLRTTRTRPARTRPTPVRPRRTLSRRTRPSPRLSAAASPRRRRRRRRSPRRRRRRRRRMRLFDRRVARSAPSERARDAHRGGDAGECVQMRDGVMTMHTRRTRPRHRRDARRARRSRRASDRPTSSTRRLSLARETRRARNADSAWRFVDRASFEKSEYRMRFAVKRAAEKRDFVDSARRCRSTRGRFFLIGGIREMPSQSWRATRVLSSHPRNPARDSSHERSFSRQQTWRVMCVATHEPRAYRH